jgi:DNA-binding transcriptional MerR regulator
MSKRRIYDAKVLGRIRVILLALDAGFTVKETKTFLNGFPTTATPAGRWRARCMRMEDCEKYMTPSRGIAR